MRYLRISRRQSALDWYSSALEATQQAQFDAYKPATLVSKVLKNKRSGLEQTIIAWCGKEKSAWQELVK